MAQIDRVDGTLTARSKSVQSMQQQTKPTGGNDPLQLNFQQVYKPDMEGQKPATEYTTIVSCIVSIVFRC